MDNMIKPKPKRSLGADVIRSLAFLSVIAVHFLGRTGFYENTVQGNKMLLITMIRSFFIICVPLFMMLSGYLMSNKKADLNYYKKIGKTYLTYVLASFCCIAFSAFYLKSEWGLKRIVLDILGFKAAPYAWYIEMYLGIFLLIPFLNILYNNIPEKKLKKLLILVMIALTSIPSIVNVYDFHSVELLTQPANKAAYDQIFPAWWVEMYPITYYFIGCYLKEFGFKMKKLPNFLLIILTVVLSGSYCYWRSYNARFAVEAWSDYNSIFCVVLTTLVFAFFINLNYDKVPSFIAKLFKLISGLSFAAYLVSWIFDVYVYPKLVSSVPVIMDRMNYAWVALIVFTASLVLSFIVGKVQFVLEWLFGLVKKLFSKIFAK